jgi:hypothetical protein
MIIDHRHTFNDNLVRLPCYGYDGFGWRAPHERSAHTGWRFALLGLAFFALFFRLTSRRQINRFADDTEELFSTSRYRFLECVLDEADQNFRQMQPFCDARTSPRGWVYWVSLTKSQATVPAGHYRHNLPGGYRVAKTSLLSGLHHEYRLEKDVA